MTDRAQKGSVEKSTKPVASKRNVDTAPGMEPPATKPALTSPAGAMTLQRTAGNRRTSSLIQASLTVGAAHDPLEQEADRVAEQVVHRSTGTPVQPHTAEDDGLMTKRDAMLDSFEAGSDFERQLGSTGGGTPLDAQTRSQMEAGIGADFSNVRVHTGAQASQLNRSISARAFTRGSDVFFDSGQYNPGSTAGKRLLAHELTHVVQQGSAQRSVQRWPWDKKNKPATGKDSTTPSNDEGEQVNETPSDTTQNTETETPTIDADYTNDAVKDQAPTRFKYTVLVWQQNKNYLYMQKVRAWTTFRNTLRKAARSVGLGKFGVRKPKTSSEMKTKTARKVAELDPAFALKQEDEKAREIQQIEGQTREMGHTWSRLTAYAGDEVKDIYSFGFWPAKGINRPDQATEGEVMHPDHVHDAHAPLRVMHYDIPAKNYNAALKWADGQVQNPSQYKMIGLNCTSWSRMLAGKAGVSFPSSGNVFPAEPAQGFYQRIFSPNKAYNDIGKQDGFEDKIDAVPKKASPYSFLINFSSNLGGNNTEESTSEEMDPPEARSVHTLTESLSVRTSRGQRTIAAGTDIMVTEVEFDGLIHVESAATGGNFNNVVRGTTDAKKFWAAVNGAQNDTTSTSENDTY